MPAALRALLAALLLVVAPSTACAFSFLSAPAADLQPLFDIADGPWLGADVATSVALDERGESYLWLHGDTLVGRMAGGVRAPTAMPRNSVAVLNVSATTGTPTSSALAHYIKVNASDAQHFGWFSPPNSTQWYWPTVGLRLAPGAVHVLAMRMFDAGSGLFPFAMAGMDLIRVGTVGSSADDPMSWPAPELLATTALWQRSNFTIGCAGALAGGDTVYLLGAAGPRQSAFMTRAPSTGLVAGSLAGLEYFSSDGSWATLPADGTTPDDVALLFDFTPSETTLVYHPFMRLWYIVIANTFIYGSSIMLRTAPAVTGPWSQEIPVYTIPAEMLAGGAFCYAGKAHAELSPQGAPEIVFSFMCNTQGIPPLLNRTDIYVPQLVRTAILGSLT